VREEWSLIVWAKTAAGTGEPVDGCLPRPTEPLPAYIAAATMRRHKERTRMGASSQLMMAPVFKSATNHCLAREPAVTLSRARLQRRTLCTLLKCGSLPTMISAPY
jgi:hypothetical protein